MPKSDRENPRCFLAVPFTGSKRQLYLRKVIRKGAEEAGYKLVTLDQSSVLPGSTIQEAIIGELARADCIIADVSDSNPNIFFELGLAQAMGKGILLISHEQSLREVPFDIREFRVITYTDGIKSFEDLSRQVYRSLRDFRRFPQRSLAAPNLQTSLPFFIDWESLPGRDAENLCQELLSQMGFRRLDWGKGPREVDLIAEYPRKDPDGFEFRELWLVSMGMRVPIEMILKIASKDPDYFLHRLFLYSERLEEAIKKSLEASVTILLVVFRKGSDSEELRMLRERFERRSLKQKSFGISIRLRIWDQHYLTSLVQRYPHIGYKYFSEEGRIRSKTRKSYEELYIERSNLLAQQTKLISTLEEEKNRRVRAERDSVWKDISFSAAHKIGNPIFAIETDLDPLTKRIRENRKQESEEVVANIRSSVEKAKAFVEQFKSLAKAQEITKTSCLLKPILEDACKAISNQEIKCSIKCPDNVVVQGDPERLSECFDELVMNATHWFDKSDKKIEVVVESPAPEPLPDFLDSSQSYALIHVKDNGCGIPVSDKGRIFDAFFTTYDHGTGLGLALVRRVIDGHGGGIIESGEPKKGADFEIYLPLYVPRKKVKEVAKKKVIKIKVAKKKVIKKKVIKKKVIKKKVAKKKVAKKKVRKE